MSLGWWKCVDDVTEFNRQHEPGGLRVVISTGPGFQYLEMQRREGAIYFDGSLTPDGKWITMKRMMIEFFVNKGHYDSNREFVTDELYAFFEGEPTIFTWKQCAQPPEYEKRVPGTDSMIIVKDYTPTDVLRIDRLKDRT
jgi:hypothetical protein